MNAPTLIPDFVNRKSFIELDARARAQSLFDEGTSKELVGPFDRIAAAARRQPHVDDDAIGCRRPWLASHGLSRYISNDRRISYTSSLAKFGKMTD